MDVLSADALDQMHVNGFAFWFVDIAAALFSQATRCTHELMARLVHHAQPDQRRLRVLDTTRESTARVDVAIATDAPQEGTFIGVGPLATAELSAPLAQTMSDQQPSAPELAVAHRSFWSMYGQSVKAWIAAADIVFMIAS